VQCEIDQGGEVKREHWNKEYVKEHWNEEYVKKIHVHLYVHYFLGFHLGYQMAEHPFLMRCKLTMGLSVELKVLLV